MGSRMKTTIEIGDALFQAAKRMAAERNTTLRAVVEVALRRYLDASAAQAQAIKIAVLQELSGAGATAGTNAKNGAMLAIKEINAAGGILGRQIEATVADTQSNPGVAKGLATKAVDDNVFAVIGPTFTFSAPASRTMFS